MTEARLKSFWRRTGALSALGLIVVAAAAAQGCSDEGTTSTTSTSATGTGGSSTTSTSDTSTGDTTSSTGTGVPMPQPPVPAADVHGAFDATPDPDNKVLYFTAIGENGPGVYSAPADGSKLAATAVYPTMPDDPASPFFSPFGIAISTNGQTLYVADASSGTMDHGAIYTLPIDGGAPKILMGTDGFSPRGLEIGVDKGSDVIYFTGRQVGPNGLPGVFKVPAAGGTVTEVSIDPSYNDPSGIAVASTGDVYFVDTSGASPGTAQVNKLTSDSGTPMVVATDVRVGYPAGIALTMDEKTAIVSALDPVTLTDRLLSIDLATGTASLIFGMELGAFTESAGLHRAKKSNSFAWADSAAGPAGGRVFAITFK